jgi:lipoprotein-releasing system ATP-binding protein
VLDLLAMLRGKSLAVQLATHNPELAARMDRTVALRDGRVVAA